MTTVQFYCSGGQLTGFLVSGHATQTANDENGRLVCAAISSAAYMAANTLSEVLGLQLNAQVQNGKMQIKLLTDFEKAQVVLTGFRLHCEQLAKQYKGSITVYSEV